MKIAVVGANGKTGRLVVAEALERGHEVVAVVRDPARVQVQHARLRVARADASDEAALTEALRNSQPLSAETRSSQPAPAFCGLSGPGAPTHWA